jgi:hypothetical protein
MPEKFIPEKSWPPPLLLAVSWFPEPLVFCQKERRVRGRFQHKQREGILTTVFVVLVEASVLVLEFVVEPPWFVFPQPPRQRFSEGAAPLKSYAEVAEAHATRRVMRTALECILNEFLKKRGE